MAQVSYGTITIIDTTDLTTYIRYATEVPLTEASQFQETPTADTRYIAVLSIPTSDSIPAWNSSNWKWSEFIGTDGLSVKDTRVLYYLKTNSTNVPQVDYNTPIVSTDTQNAWTSKNPTYVANGTYWTCLEVTLSNNTTKSWSAPTEDLGLTQTAKDVVETKSIATGINQHFFSIPSNYSESVPAGSYITEINVDEFKQSPSGGNLLTRSDGVWLRNGADILASLQGTGLTFLIPTGTYKGRKSLEILGGTAPALKLYDAQDNNAAATLNSNGLVLSKGGIKAGTPNSKGFIYLSSEDYPGNITINNHSPLEKYTEVENPEGSPKERGWYEKNEEEYIPTEDTEVQQGKVYYQDESDPKWRQVIGNKFGVDSEGNLYADGASIAGTIYIGERNTQPLNNYIQLTSSGMGIFKKRESNFYKVASFSDTVRIGEENGFHLIIADSTIEFKNGNETLSYLALDKFFFINGEVSSSLFFPKYSLREGNDGKFIIGRR